jgi:hypothetical protein
MGGVGCKECTPQPQPHPYRANAVTPQKHPLEQLSTSSFHRHCYSHLHPDHHPLIPFYSLLVSVWLHLVHFYSFYFLRFSLPFLQNQPCFLPSLCLLCGCHFVWFYQNPFYEVWGQHLVSCLCLSWSPM